MSDDLAVDFANTAEWHAGPEPIESLTSYGRAVVWAQEHGVLAEDQAKALVERAARQPAAEAAALERVISVREAIYRVLASVAHRQMPAAADLSVLDREVEEGSSHLRLAVDPGEGQDGPPRFRWVWSGLEQELTGFLWPVARSATELLMSGRLPQVRECAGDPCGWLFFDLSKNGSRRWCDMAGCGNRAKAKRYRERKRDTRAPQDPGLHSTP